MLVFQGWCSLLLVVQQNCLCSSGLTRECSFHRQTAGFRLSEGVSVLRHTYFKDVPSQELDRRLSKKMTHRGEAGCKPIRGLGLTTLKVSALNNSTAELLIFSRSNILIWVKGKDVGRLRCEYLRPSSGTMAQAEMQRVSNGRAASAAQSARAML